MRISVRKDDPGYQANAFDYCVFLDGKELEQCFTADEELGLAYCYQATSNGVPIVDRSGPEPKLKEITRRGKVEIRYRLEPKTGAKL